MKSFREFFDEHYCDLDEAGFTDDAKQELVKNRMWTDYQADGYMRPDNKKTIKYPQPIHRGSGRTWSEGPAEVWVTVGGKGGGTGRHNARIDVKTGTITSGVFAGKSIDDLHSLSKSANKFGRKESGLSAKVKGGTDYINTKELSKKDRKKISTIHKQKDEARNSADRLSAQRRLRDGVGDRMNPEKLKRALMKSERNDPLGSNYPKRAAYNEIGQRSPGFGMMQATTPNLLGATVPTQTRALEIKRRAEGRAAAKAVKNGEGLDNFDNNPRRRDADVKHVNVEHYQKRYKEKLKQERSPKNSKGNLRKKAGGAKRTYGSQLGGKNPFIKPNPIIRDRAFR